MGACASGEAGDSGTWDHGDDTFNEDAERKRTREDKDGNTVEADPGDDDARPEDDFFDVDDAEEVEEGKEFLAVKPWKGQIAEPESHPEADRSAPEVEYRLEYAYGYRCQDSRQNVYYNADGNVAYMTACLGVILNKADNTQCFFGGGEVENKSKQVASSAQHHSNDIMAMNVNTSGGRNMAATGQVGKNAAVFVWDAQTGDKQRRHALPKNARGVSAIALSPDCKYVAVADRHNDHYITVWDESGNQCMKDKSGPDLIFDLAFTKKDGCYDLWSAGRKHFAHWDIQKGKKQKGIYNRVSGQTSHSCVTSCPSGGAYSGGSNSKVHIWEERTLKQVVDCHKGFCGAIKWVEGSLYSGGKDGIINQLSHDDAGVWSVAKSFNLGHGLIRSVDVMGENMVCGFRNGCIIEIAMADNSENCLMESHHDGEVWGLAMNAESVYTSGDDNQVKKWCPTSRKCQGSDAVSDKVRKAKRNRASTLSKYPCSKASRALAVGPNGHIAICCNDGHVYIRDLACVGDPAQQMQNLHDLDQPDEWCEVAEYSPNGTYLAVGSHDTDLYIYKTEDYSLVGKANSHKATITCLDWSMDEAHIKSSCNGYEVLYFDISGEGITHDPSGRSNSVGYDWATGHTKFGWLVDGIFPRGTDGSHVNGVDFNEDKSLITVADDYGLVQLFRNPCRKGHAPKSMRGHSEHVVRARFGTGALNQWLFSVGGYDQTMLQWILV